MSSPQLALRRVRVLCQVIAFACASVLLVIVNTSLKEGRFAFVTGVVLIAVGAVAVVVGILLASREAKTAGRSNDEQS